MKAKRACGSLRRKFTAPSSSRDLGSPFFSWSYTQLEL